ncbi:MAG: hypothetical protein HAW62_06060 [Endozoicomonadaceae bacterium]|nr:hypothetical protein [Endozoicomonadaceae bacterium]
MIHSTLPNTHDVLSTSVNPESQHDSPPPAKRACIEKKPPTHARVIDPRDNLKVNPARFESIEHDRNENTLFSSDTQALREYYSPAFKKRLTLLDIYKDLENQDMISAKVLICTRDNQSYALYEARTKHMIFLEKINNIYQIKQCVFNTDTQLFQLESQFEFDITAIPEHIINESIAFQWRNPMIEPANPFARQVFILDHFIKQDPNITYQDIDGESYQVMLEALR